LDQVPIHASNNSRSFDIVASKITTLRLRSQLLANHEVEITAQELRVDPHREPGIGNLFHHLKYVVARCSVNFKTCRLDELESLFGSLGDANGEDSAISKRFMRRAAKLCAPLVGSLSRLRRCLSSSKTDGRR